MAYQVKTNLETMPTMAPIIVKQEPPQNRTLPATHLYRAAGIAAVVGLLAWFTLPVFDGQYNEGFQTITVMNAETIVGGHVHGVDIIYPLVNRFFLNSRFGLSVVLAGLLKLGFSAVNGFRVVQLLSLIGLVAANAAILVRRYGVHPIYACLPALLFPGLFETAWFPNDNLLSAALSSTALLLFWTRPTLLATAASALLLGLAIACRTDAVLLAPAFLVLMWFEVPTWPQRISRALVAGLIVAAVPLLVYAAFGLHFLDILSLTHRAGIAWDRHDPISHLLHPALKGFSMPGLLLAAVGAVTVIQRRQWREIMLCLAVPLVYAAAYGLMLTEVRYLVPLTPFFGILLVVGMRAVLAATGRWGTAGRAALVVTGLLCFVPPVAPPLHALWFLTTDNDMTRPWMGRFWSPALAMWWNNKLEQGYEVAVAAVPAAAAPGGLGVIVSTRWTPDHAVELILREDGFTGSRATEPASCREIGEVFTRGDERVMHLRLHIPLIPKERSLVTWEALGAPCLRDLGKMESDRVLVIGQTLISDPPVGLSMPGVTPMHVPALDINPWARFIAGKSYSYFVATAEVADIPWLLKAPETEKEEVGAEWAVDHRAVLD